MGNGKESSFYPGDVMQWVGGGLCLVAAGTMVMYGVWYQPAALLSGLILLFTGTVLCVAGTIFEFTDKWKQNKPAADPGDGQQHRQRPEVEQNEILGGQRKLEHFEALGELSQGAVIPARKAK